MKCVECLPLAGGWKDGALDGDAREDEVALHVASCARCAGQLAAFEGVAALLRSRLAAQADAADFSRLAADVLRRVRVERKEPWRARASAWLTEMLRYHRYATSGFAAAAAALAIGLPVLFGSGLGSGSNGPLAIHEHTAANDVEVEELEVEHQGGTVLSTAEGTTIWLSPEDPDGHEAKQ